MIMSYTENLEETNYGVEKEKFNDDIDEKKK